MANLGSIFPWWHSQCDQCLYKWKVTVVVLCRMRKERWREFKFKSCFLTSAHLANHCVKWVSHYPFCKVTETVVCSPSNFIGNVWREGFEAMFDHPSSILVEVCWQLKTEGVHPYLQTAIIHMLMCLLTVRTGHLLFGMQEGLQASIAFSLFDLLYGHKGTWGCIQSAQREPGGLSKHQ